MGWLGGVDLVQAVARDARQGQTSESSGSTTRRPSVPCPSTIGTGSTCSHGQREESSSLASLAEGSSTRAKRCGLLNVGKRVTHTVAAPIVDAKAGG